MNQRTLLPSLFREALVVIGMPAIDEWWAELDEASRADALQLWQDCNESGARLAFRVEAQVDEGTERGEFWHSDYYDYLVNHEAYFVPQKIAHICTRHPVAAQAVRRGVIPHDFGCPFADADCPMRKLLGNAPGRSLRLSVRLIFRDSDTTLSHVRSA